MGILAQVAFYAQNGNLCRRPPAARVRCGAMPSTLRCSLSLLSVVGFGVGTALLIVRLSRRRTSHLCNALVTQASTHEAVRVVILGLGYCGGAIGRYLALRGCQVLGTTRGEANQLDTNAGVRIVVLGSNSPDSAVNDVANAIREARLVIATAPPADAGDPFLADGVIRRALGEIQNREALIVYLSSVGVYGD